MTGNAKRELVSNVLAVLTPAQRDYAVPYLLNAMAQMLTEERLRTALDAAVRFAEKHAPTVDEESAL